MKNILYITYDGLSDPLGRSQILPYLTELAPHGFKFTILSFEKKEAMEREGETVKMLVTEAGIKWVPLPFTAKPPVLAKIWDRWQMRRKAFTLHQSLNFDLVHCRSYVAAEVGLALKREKSVPYIFDMRGFWADEKVDNGQWNQGSLLFRQLYRFYKHKEAAMLLGASSVVTLTHAAKQYLLAQPSYKNLPISVIPCCADLNHYNFKSVSAGRMQQIRQELCLLPHHKVLVYLGSVGGWYQTKEMFRYFFLLYQSSPEYRMLVLTKDDPSIVMAEAVEQGCNPESLIVRYVPREEVPDYLAICDNSIFFIRNSFSKMASSPTKHAELMGMGLPVICNDIGDTGTIVRTTGTGWLVNEPYAFTSDEVAAIQDELKEIDKESIRLAAHQYFDLKVGSAAYLRIYQQLLFHSNPEKGKLRA